MKPAVRLVRDALPKDIAEIVAIDHASFPLAEDEGRTLRQKRFENELGSTEAKLWVVEGDGQILAYLSAWIAPGETHLLHVATRADLRRQGVGRALVQHLLEFSERLDSIVVLEVRTHNEAAKRLYENMGFEVSRVRKAYYPDGEDAIEFVWRRP